MLELTSTSESSPGPNSPQLSEAFPGLTREEWGGVWGGYLPPLLPTPPPPFSRSDHYYLIADCQDDQSELQA